LSGVDLRRRTLLRAMGAAPLMLLGEHALAGSVWDLRAMRRCSAADLVDALRGAACRLLGEVHDNALQHAIQNDLLAALGEHGLKPAVAFEQFDNQYDAALRSPDIATAESVALAVQFNRKNWNWDFYRPLVETALRHRMPLRAANLSRAKAAAIARQPAPAAFDAPWSAQKETLLRETIFEGHCRALPERLMPGMAAAQRARDRALAAALADAPGDGAVLIAGNGHVRRDLGVPLYLPRPCLSLGLLEVEAGKSDPPDYVLPFDFVWFTPRAKREDPCNAFTPR
jgi:uncharacterized iron-regulated protein